MLVVTVHALKKTLFLVLHRLKLEVLLALTRTLFLVCYRMKLVLLDLFIEFRLAEVYEFFQSLENYLAKYDYFDH